ncbi:MAG: hypothetical protein ACRDYX_09625 [Egibacteraceae bacterium]
MEVEFEDRGLARTCADLSRMARTLGREQAKRLGMRLTLLAAAATLKTYGMDRADSTSSPGTTLKSSTLT